MPVNKHRYLFLIGFLIILSFVVIGLLINKRLDLSVSKISGSLTQNVYRQKADFYNTQFKEPLKAMSSAGDLLKGAANIRQAEGLIPAIRTILFSDAKVNNIWYAFISGRDTSFYTIERLPDGSFSSDSNPGYLKSRILKEYSISGESGKTKLLKVEGFVHWINGRKLGFRDSSEIIFGFDIDLKELQKYFRETDPLLQSYAFITDKDGFCISHPDESLIGKRIIPETRFPVILNNLQKAGNLIDTLNSGYLKVPVVRYYTSVDIETERWILVIDTPTLLFDDEVTDIRDYTIGIGLCCVIVVIALIIIAQRTWQKEFLMRQQAEDLQSELLFEKQQLQITTEKQQKENALLQLGKLKEKINPHFLFNSLVSLNGLISQDAGMAKEFVVKLSKVYRYVLNEFPDSLSSAEEEIRFAEQYNFLLKIRFGDALLPLQVKLHDMPENGKLPFMSLQTAVENAVKHNVLSKSQPLGISIEFENDCLIVSNNLQLRKDMNDSSGHGLAYIESIYRHYGNERFRHGAEGEIYRCYLPLL